MVEHLLRMIPNFHGASSWTQCFPHILILIAKISILMSSSTNANHFLQVFLSSFYHQHSKSKTTESEKPLRQGGHSKQPVSDESCKPYLYGCSFAIPQLNQNPYRIAESMYEGKKLGYPTLIEEMHTTIYTYFPTLATTRSHSLQVSSWWWK